ncbi:penicillin-binding transpeptidase domain-containing protein [Actinomadura sp. SCN-SB]|uniref:penicillin-binding transpeptidase domain-containing protein n=1 Tax=Actinomadura sp. SCN-SB TaxID=3373092 RepID=UPI0037511D64
MSERVRVRARRVIAMASCAGLVIAGATACFAEPSALPTMRDFLIAWQVGNVQAAASKTTGADRAAVARALDDVSGQLDAASLKLALGTPVQEGAERSESQAIVRKGDTAEADFAVKVDLGENGQPWTYKGHMRLKRINGVWKVVWDPSIIHPSLKPGQRLAVVTEVPPRAPIQDSAARSVLREVPAVIVGVYPGQLREPDQTVRQMVRATRLDEGQLDSERLLGRIRSAPPNAFLPLLTLQLPANNALILRLRQIQGLQFRQDRAPIAPLLAPELVGRLGPATADRLQQVGAPYQIGDTIGVTGLQLLQQRRLAGIPTVRVVAQDPDGRERQELRSWPGQDPQPVRTTLDRKIQPRAETALSALRVPASMVAVRPSTGEILAVANHLTKGENRAMEAQYAPGMAFSIVSAQALLNSGMAQNARTDCPPSASVGGRTFTNPGGGSRGRATLQWNFAYSCATTLVSLSNRLTPDALVAEAGRLGLGKNWGLSVPAFSGTVPRPANDAEKAALMLGQGKVRVSPLAMALVAGATENGTWRPPYLLNDPRDPQQVAAQPLNPVTTSDMKLLMRRSVAQGTARSANVAGGARVSGVAAIADQDGKPVSWFVGSRGDLAFAIAVEGRVNAAAVASYFLTGPPRAAR